MSEPSNLIWHLVLKQKDQLQENRVMTVVAGHKQICLTRFEGTISALDNHCPHQGGPLGEGSIENGTLRFPGTDGITILVRVKHRVLMMGLKPIRFLKKKTESTLAFPKRSLMKPRFQISWPKPWSTGV